MHNLDQVSKGCVCMIKVVGGLGCGVEPWCRSGQL